MDSAQEIITSKEGLTALLTGFFLFLSLALFVKDFLRGKSKPYLWAWVIRVGLCVVAFWSQLLQGATYSLALAVSQIICGACIVALILYKGSSQSKLDRIDWLALSIAALGVLLWIVSGDPLFSLMGVIVADSCATVMGIRAAIQKGTRESLAFWTCALMAASMAVIAAGSASWIILLAPLFSCANAIANILTTLYVRKKIKRRSYAYQAEAI